MEESPIATTTETPPAAAPAPARLSPAEVIMQAVLHKDVDLSKVKELLEIQKQWDAEQARKAYHLAMARFKANPPSIKKDKGVNYKTDKGSVSYKHATLANVTETINTAMSAYGLSSSWRIDQSVPNSIAVTCKVTHEQGHFEEVMIRAQADTSGSKNSIQAIGSTISYLERYTLLAIAGIATHDQDDDGRGAGPQSGKPAGSMMPKEAAVVTAMDPGKPGADKTVTQTVSAPEVRAAVNMASKRFIHDAGSTVTYGKLATETEFAAWIKTPPAQFIVSHAEDMGVGTDDAIKFLAGQAQNISLAQLVKDGNALVDAWVSGDLK